MHNECYICKQLAYGFMTVNYNNTDMRYPMCYNHMLKVGLFIQKLADKKEKSNE